MDDLYTYVSSVITATAVGDEVILRLTFDQAVELQTALEIAGDM